MNLGETIKLKRQKKGLNQTSFANLCGITQTYLSQIENNSKEPNLSTLKNIASQLNVPLPILFYLSLDSEDISQEKKAAFEIISPSLKALVSEFF